MEAPCIHHEQQVHMEGLAHESTCPSMPHIHSVVVSFLGLLAAPQVSACPEPLCQQAFIPSLQEIELHLYPGAHFSKLYTFTQEESKMTHTVPSGRTKISCG